MLSNPPRWPSPMIRFGAVLVLSAITAGVYSNAVHFDFVAFDDAAYVSENTNVTVGLTPESITWALTTLHFANWHPLTWLSFMLDVELFGVDPGKHHAVNIIFHVCNTMFVFVLLFILTRRFSRSYLVAALFALHPMHVESVAWISERKDLLSTFWGLLALICYVAYARSGRSRWYLLCSFLFVLSLMSKAMLVTLPCVMLLLDVWPLGRLRIGGNDISLRSNGLIPESARRVIVEKLPFFFLIFFVTMVNFVAQSLSGAVGSIPLWSRVANAAISYVAYISKLIWPARLSVFYVHPGIDVSLMYAAGALVLLAAVSVGLVGGWRTHPALAVGWLWFLGMLVPVIGIVQVGSQAMADRYTYVPSIGLFIVCVWGGAGLLTRMRLTRRMQGLIGVAWLIVLAILCFVQVSYWKDTKTLFYHALEVNPENWRAHSGLGSHFLREGRLNNAEYHLKSALKLHPSHARTQYNMGSLMFDRGQLRPAADHYRWALKSDPGFIDAHFNLGLVYGMLDEYENAETQFRRVVELDPDNTTAWHNLGFALERMGKDMGARMCLQKEAQLRRTSVPSDEKR